MTITGTTFDRMRVTSDKDAALFHTLNRGLDHVIRGYKNDMLVTTSGLNLYVDTGAAVVEGRFVEVTAKETIAVPANTTGFLAITVDLTQENTSTGTPGNADYLPVNNQVKLQVVNNLVQQEMFKDGKIYMMPLIAYKSTGSAVAVTDSAPSNKIELTQNIISGSAWKMYGTGYKIWAYDYGEFYVLTGYITLASSLAAGATSKFLKLPDSLKPKGTSYDITMYTSKRLYNVYYNIESNDISIGDIYNVNDTGLKAQGPGGWYTLAMMMPKENGHTIDVNTDNTIS